MSEDANYFLEALDRIVPTKTYHGRHCVTGANDCPFLSCLGRESLAGRPATELRRASIVFLLLSSAMGARGGGG